MGIMGMLRGGHRMRRKGPSSSSLGGGNQCDRVGSRESPSYPSLASCLNNGVSYQWLEGKGAGCS